MIFKPEQLSPTNLKMLAQKAIKDSESKYVDVIVKSMEEVSKELKSYGQLKSVYRLCKTLIPLFKEHVPDEYWDERRIIEAMKLQFKYYTDLGNGCKVTKSLKYMSKDDMIRFIKTIECYGQERGIKNCYIESIEMQELINYYDKNKGKI